ncbi:MAG: class I SAM-dependent methyltransferase [Bacteroidetes bacterium]|nr:MAG: class I SAM-dependent methyltransferase [Bacteroidota bacterium]
MSHNTSVAHKTALLTAPIRLMWRDVKDSVRLQQVPSSRLNDQALLSAKDVHLDRIFRSEVIAKAFAEDQEEIAALQLPLSTGGVNPGDQRALYYLARYFRPASVLEVGTHIGCSTVHLALALRPFTESRILSVDITDVNDPETQPWLSYHSKHAPREMTRRLGCGDQVRYHVEDSLQFMADTDQRFDFIFLDGDHAGATVYKEIPLALRILNPGGVIVLHDFFPEGKPLWKEEYPIKGPFRAVSRFAGEGQHIRAIPLGDLPWTTKRGGNTTSLALLTRSH